MRQYVCDRCGEIINGGMHQRLYVWHRSIVKEEHDGHYDLCDACDKVIIDTMNATVDVT